MGWLDLVLLHTHSMQRAVRSLTAWQWICLLEMNCLKRLPYLQGLPALKMAPSWNACRF